MKKILTYSFITAGLIGALSIGGVSAHGWFGLDEDATPEEVAQRQELMFEKKADLLGISVDQVKEAWAQGKNFKELAQEQGITQEELQTRMRETNQERMEAHLQALVDGGVITQAQADSRLQNMQDKIASGQMKRGSNRGFGGCLE